MKAVTLNLPNVNFLSFSSLGAIIIKATYGLDVAETDDPYITASDKAAQTLELLLAGSSLLEYFPFLAHVPMWLPGTKLLVRLKEALRATTEARELPWQDGKKFMVRFFLFFHP